MNQPSKLTIRRASFHIARRALRPALMVTLGDLLAAKGQRLVGR